MIAAALLLAAPAGQEPPAERLAALLRPCREAAAIEAVVHLRGELPAAAAGPPRPIADVRLSLRFARPAAGRLEWRGRMWTGADPTEDGALPLTPIDRSLLGDGERLYLVERRERRFRRLAGGLADLGPDWPALLPLQVWAGVETEPILAVEALPDPPETGWRGFRVRSRWHLAEYWFDADGAFRAARLLPDPELDRLQRRSGQPPLPRYRAEIELWRLHPCADPKAWRARPPADFVAASSEEKEETAPKQREEDRP
ncbi:MAG: hypothetical protein D6702_12055 [Planctomycetota bacterium]|nr:MAG: hypothetical protein D6702_12055 [Planctomycetota bacterium]